MFSFPSCMTMSPPCRLPSPAVEAADEQSPKVPLERLSGGSSARVSSVGEASSLSFHPDFPRRQRSYFTVVDEKVLCHNYDIPPYMSLHFPDGSTWMIGRPGDICVYERMFLAIVRLPFAPIITELLSFLGIALRHLMPNGLRYFLPMFLLWHAEFPGEA